VRHNVCKVKRVGILEKDRKSYLVVRAMCGVKVIEKKVTEELMDMLD